MPQPKFSFQNETVTIPETKISFKQLVVLEKALNEQAIVAFCDAVDVNEGKLIKQVGQIFGLEIDPDPSDAPAETPESGEPELYSVDETTVAV